MEDVLDLYEEEYDPRYPTVCLDEKLVVLHKQIRPVKLPTPGRPERRDDEYARRATIDWQFTARQAHVKLKKLHPVVNSRLD